MQFQLTTPFAFFIKRVYIERRSNLQQLCDVFCFPTKSKYNYIISDRQKSFYSPSLDISEKLYSSSFEQTLNQSEPFL